MQVTETPLVLAGCCSEEVIANPWAVAIATAAAPPGGPLSVAFTGNTNCPGSRTQPVHRDSAHSRRPLTSFVINICPCDTSLHNGAIELWSGTHAEIAVGETVILLTSPLQHC